MDTPGLVFYFFIFRYSQYCYLEKKYMGLKYFDIQMKWAV